jgi:hypothetical protein
MAQTAIVTGGSNGILQAEALASPETLNGPLILANQTAAPTAVAAAGTLYALSGQPQWENPQGLTGSVPGCQGGLATAGIVTVNTTSAETVLQSFSIPAADPVAGSVYQMVGWGVYGTTGTPTLAWGSRWGGVSGTSLSTIDATTLGSSLTNVAFKIDCLLNFLSTTTAQVVMALDLSTSSTTNATTRLMNSPSAAVTVSATAAKVWVTTVTFSASNASNTISLLGAYTLRLA